MKGKENLLGGVLIVRRKKSKDTYIGRMQGMSVKLQRPREIGAMITAEAEDKGLALGLTSVPPKGASVSA